MCLLAIMVNIMPSKPPVIFPQEQRMLTQLGERIKLARLRRGLSTTVVSLRARISRSSLYNVECGDPGATLGTYFRVLAVLALDGDFNALAADDKVGRKLQDLALTPPKGTKGTKGTRGTRAAGARKPSSGRVSPGKSDAVGQPDPSGDVP